MERYIAPKAIDGIKNGRKDSCSTTLPDVFPRPLDIIYPTIEPIIVAKKEQAIANFSVLYMDLHIIGFLKIPGSPSAIVLLDSPNQ